MSDVEKINAWPRHIIKFLHALKLILIMMLLAPYNKLGNLLERENQDIKQDTDYYYYKINK